MIYVRDQLTLLKGAILVKFQLCKPHMKDKEKKS